MARIAAVAVIAALCATTVKKHTPELGLLLGLTAGCLILSLSLDALRGVRSMLDALGDTAGLSPAVLSTVIKTVGIAIVTHMAAEVCRDAKEGGIAAFLETAGAVMALFVCLPLLEAVLSAITQLL